MRILANDGIAQSGIEALEKAGFVVILTKVAQEQLINYINEENIEALLVRSNTKVRQDLIEKCPGLKLIGRGGVGMDNIDVDFAKSKGLHVINTPAASSDSVAELVFAHLLSGIRFLHDANRNMPLEGDSKFKQLKKSYQNGLELRGKTIGIIGFGRIGRSVAKSAIGLGMNVMFSDHHNEDQEIELGFFDGQSITFSLSPSPKEELLKNSDYITVHVPASKDYLIGKEELKMMKDGVGIVNASRGGVIDEVALVDALDSGKVGFAGLDVFESEPNPEIRILMHPKISLSPHIGGSTIEAQERIGLELANQIISLLQ